MTRAEKDVWNREIARRIRGDLRLLRLDCAVRVEGKKDADEMFWSHILKRVLPDLTFKVFRYANYPTGEATGKSNVLAFKAFAGRDFILCVDSDYDYLLGKEDLAHPFVFQTYLYSIESYQCYAPSLLPIFKQFLDLNADYDFVDLMERYSSIIYKLLVYSLFSMKTDGEFNADKCGSMIGFNRIKDLELALIELTQNVESQCLNWSTQYDSVPEFVAFNTRISKLGLTEENAYLFIKGHDIKGKVVKRFLEAVAKPFISAEFERRNKESGSDGAAQYQDHLNDNSFDNLLKNNINYTDCSFYQKIENDLRTAFIVQ